MNDNCRFCDATDHLEEHHVVPRRYGGTDEDQNLITVCSDCHKTIERTWDAEFYHEIGVRSGMTPDVMFDTIRELRWTLLRVHAAVTGAYTLHDEKLEYADKEPIEEGRYLTEYDIQKLKRDVCRDLLEGESGLGFYPIKDLERLREETDRLMSDVLEGDR
ncbi:HNH endonuclease [Natronomonas halophila]|uniref:HNH endonuclease n=1 Tax=Natronomonas halophila TaxID=2747817 RepID=UPI0015B3E217|nr:HNH endonuclease [Natronomonas halophila]QLD84586.1 HNH endonuclease [Natronomonas halophila]QLD84642.1 HNH endonuclease [Natronomonas halophila]